MSGTYSVAAVSALLLVISSSSLQAQASAPEPAGPSHDSNASVYVAKGTRASLQIDGFVSEQIWEVAEKADQFTQLAPRAGQPSSEATDLRILTTNDGVALSARLFDQQAEKIVLTPGKADAFEVSFDVSHDHRDALVLTVEASGEHHATLIKDGVKSDLASLKWSAAARRNAKGWSAEILLPFSSLTEFAPTAKWGWQARRYIARKDEWSTTANMQAGDVSEFAHLQVESKKLAHQ